MMIGCDEQILERGLLPREVELEVMWVEVLEWIDWGMKVVRDRLL